MSKTIKPSDFPQVSLPLNKELEIYTQTGGVNGKFKVKDIEAVLSITNTTIYSGDTIINNDTIYITGGTVLASGGTTVINNSTIISGSTSILTDNGDGTYTHSDGMIPANTTTIKPTNYSYTELKTGARWVDNKEIYRIVVELEQWTTAGDETGEILLGSGQTFESIVTLRMFAKITSGSDYGVGNLIGGIDTTFTGNVGVLYKAATNESFLYWENMYNTSNIVSERPVVYFILEYTKP